MLQQVAGKRRGACGPVALSHQEQGRIPSFVPSQIEPDEFCNRRSITLDAKIFSGQLRLHGAAVASAHRIDEHQVGLVEPGILIVGNGIGRRWHEAFRLHLHDTWSDRAHVQPHRSRARTTIEAEHERPLRMIPTALLVERVGDKKYIGFSLALIILERHEASGGRVVQRCAADVEYVVRDDCRRFGLALRAGSVAVPGISFCRVGIDTVRLLRVKSRNPDRQ